MKDLLNPIAPAGAVLTLFLAVFTGFAGAAPAITAVQNNYGQIAQGLPNYGIAPGSLFFVQGTALANATTTLQSSAAPGLQTTLDGVSVTVSVGGTTAKCFLYCLSPTQIDAVLPGTTPVGTGTITVTNGADSTPTDIVVVPSAFGILSYNGTLAAAYDANNTLLTNTNSARPGQTIVLWGSGVGYDPADDDKTFPQKQNNLTSIPMEAYVGGVAATIVYRGRSQYPGVDQVVITIPQLVPAGCYVSVAIVSGSIVSNSVTIPVAANGSACSDPGPAGSGGTTVRYGLLNVSQSTSIISGRTQVTNQAFGLFESISGFSGSSDSPPVSAGSCVVYSSASPGAATTAALDAGASIKLTGPKGEVIMPVVVVPGAPPGTLYQPTSVPADFIPAAGGTFTFDNGSGGRDVQHFSASVNLPASFTWTNQAQITEVRRSAGVTVTWSGGTPGTYVAISGGSTATIGGQILTITFACAAPQAALQFSVPLPVLLAMPVGTGSLVVGDYAVSVPFTATGLDAGSVSGGVETYKALNYN